MKEYDLQHCTLCHDPLARPGNANHINHFVDDNNSDHIYNNANIMLFLLRNMTCSTARSTTDLWLAQVMRIVSIVSLMIQPIEFGVSSPISKLH